MKKQQVEHVLRAAGRITGQKRLIIIGSQSLHGAHPDLADEILTSFEVDIVAARNVEWLNAIGSDSPFHESFGYFADPVDESTAILPKGWKARLINLASGDTEGVQGLCLEPHDLAIAKYVAGREKDNVFTRELVRRGIVKRDKLLLLLEHTPLSEEQRERIRTRIDHDFSLVRK